MENPNNETWRHAPVNRNKKQNDIYAYNVWLMDSGNREENMKEVIL